MKAISLHKEWSFSIKDFFSKCDQIHRKTSDLVTFTAEILNEKLHFLCSVCYIKPNFFYRERTPYKIPVICHCGIKYVTMEWIELNWLRKHMEKVRSRKAFILNKFLYWIKLNSFLEYRYCFFFDFRKTCRKAWKCISLFCH